MAERHQILPGIGDGGHTRVGDQNGGLPCQQAGADLFAPFPPVVLKIADKRLFNAEMGEQPERDPRILGGDKVAGFQRLQCAG